MTARFYHQEPLPEQALWLLPDAIAHHATRVLRLGEGDRIVLFDGLGGEVSASLHQCGKAWQARLEPRRMLERESPLALVLVQGLASSDKMDWIIQKAVELGASAVVPLRAERSVLKLSPERSIKKTQHWHQVMVSACEQCGRNRIPDLRPLTGLSDYLDQSAAATRFVLAPQGGAGLNPAFCPDGEVHLLVGPEGGWSDAELQLCLAQACIPMSLGPRILRTETAGLAALAAMQALWGDF